ncbi:DNA gyrase inhibitor YacG [Sphingomicrobium lutaoense]|uniref:DNA gyrase inhibitor YacG n=1 Tax=Sphingomicrobium lutaoense TaxID=515949 RepID=UPI00160AE50F|nr:DNA gyrase inhibitor YacG [Sphingomicrobium lutaoense]
MPSKSEPRCPKCGKKSSPDTRPFCSRGCKDRDLLNWLGDGYRIPGPPADIEGLDSEEDQG